MLSKTIWLLWLQGWDSAPWLVRQVAESWETNNPEWNIEYVTLDNLYKYISDVDYIYDQTKEIIPAHKADIIRLSLLKNYGGVWADATMLCMQPLDTWVEEAVQPAGLWMYHGHGGGMNGKNGPAIWLIASEKDSLMISKWKKACDEYWEGRIRAHSYFWLDELFKKLFESDVEFRNRWHFAPHLYCETKKQAHSLARRNRMISSSRELKRIFQEEPPYALKFWWKQWEDAFPDPDSIECKKSTGYFAIQMSKRKIVFKHHMASKDSIWFLVRMFMWNIRYFTMKKLWFTPKYIFKKWKRRLLKNSS